MKRILKHRIIPFLPLVLVELYLGFTLLLYQFGPLRWQTENVVLFWLYIASYHIAFVLGYLLFVKKFKISGKSRAVNNFEKFIIRYMWVFLIICAFLSLIKYKNTVGSNGLLPVDLPSEFYKGLINPGERYNLKIINSAVVTYDGNKLFTGIYAIFSFVSWSMIPICIFFWNRIKNSQKLVFLILVFFEFATWVSIGTNKGVFDILFLFATSLAIDVTVNFKKNGFKTIRDKYGIIIITSFLLIFSFWFFTYGMTTRVGSVETSIATIEGVSVKEDDSASQKVGDSTSQVAQDSTSQTTQKVIPTPNAKSKFRVQLDNLFYGMSSYLCQGYHGMSLALDEPFTSTYGIGNSIFLMSNFKTILNIDVYSNTYQMKVNDKWSAQGQWHSFYSYMANDIHFIGVIFLMFCIGAFSAITWKDAIYGKNIVSQCLLTLFIILFLYIPANNQVFGFLQTFSAFLELSFIWIFIRIISKKYKNRLGMRNGKI